MTKPQVIRAQGCFIQLVMFVFALALTILVMIYGWGLEPQSWWWIIGCGIGIRLAAEIIEQINKKVMKEGREQE